MADILAAALPKPRREMIFISPDVNVFECCEIMVKQDIGALVIKEGDDIKGIVSERDLVRNCLFKRTDADQIKASEIMSSNITILPIEATVEEAISKITSTKRRHILVEEDGKVIAILSQGDILFHMLQTSQLKVDQLERYIFNN